MFDAQRDGSPVVVVGLGASAGGLEALQAFFEQLPADTGAAFVVVQHLSPDFKSLMTEILGRHTTMQITRVEDREKLRPDTVYLIPPRVDIRVDGDTLRIDPQHESKTVQHPINVFFQSMADSCRGACLAIVLSGTGTDGAIGVKAVKESGGVVLVQDPETARFDGMPRAAISSTVADFALPPAELAERVADLVGRVVRMEEGDETDELPSGETVHFEAILEVIERETGLQLSSYKPATILRRTQRRMAMHQLTSMLSYLQLVRRDGDECRALARDCLIHVTRFFRDGVAFDRLRQQVSTKLVTHVGGDQPYRIWVVGCSTGEEAYSISIMLEHVLQETGARCDYKVFCTDLDAEAVETASAGRYLRGNILGLSDSDASQYFTADGELLVVGPRIRNRMVFARHNVLSDPPFPRADLVVCRNLLIYLKPSAQKLILERLHYSLVKDGLMFLGPSEVMDPILADYRVIDPKWRLFEKTVDRQSSLTSAMGERAANPAPQLPFPVRSRRPAVRESELTRACERLVSNFARCAFVVTEDGQVAFTFGDSTGVLSLPRGVATTRFEDLLPEPARGAVRIAIRQSKSTEGAVHMPAVAFGDDELHRVDVLHVEGVDCDPVSVVLIDHGEDVAAEEVTGFLDADEALRGQISTLEAELQSSRESLQATIEELETTNEEMQAVNEELLSSNEELQSTNEELHSVNEELYTVNAEHQSKISQLAEVTEDLENLLDATRIGMVFVDGALRVRRFTAEAQLGLPLRDSDIGRGLGELSLRIDADLVAIVAEVLVSREPWERRLVNHDGVPVLIAVRPHGVQHTAHEGCVITIVDLTLQTARQGADSGMLETVLEHLPQEVLWVREAESGRLVYVSPGAEDVWGIAAARCLEEPGRWSDLIHGDDRARLEDEHGDAGPHEPGTSAIYRVIRDDGEVLWVEHRCLGAFHDDRGERFICGLVSDQTQRLRRESEKRAQSHVVTRALELTPGPHMIVRDRRITWLNAAARTQLSFQPGRSPGRLTDLPMDAEHRQVLEVATRQVGNQAEGAESQVVEVALTGPDGEDIPVRMEVLALASPDDQAPGTVLLHWTDPRPSMAVEHELRERNLELQAEAMTDPLTGLLNRRGLEHALRGELALSSRTGDTVMVLLIDCDRFKQLNDEHSHTVGDRVLQEIAHRLRSALRPCDAVGRIGGDEFVAVLPATRVAEGAHVGEKLRRLIGERAFEVDGLQLGVTISVGVATASSACRQVDELIRQADELLKSSKTGGRNTVSVANGSSNAQVDSGPDPVEELLLPGGVRVAMQAITELGSGEMVGMELLARAARGEMCPTDFFGMAQATGRLEALDVQCFRACVDHFRGLQSEQRCHINLFPSTLLGERGEDLMEILDRVESPSSVCVELSEQQFVGPSSALRNRLQAMRERGFRIALDDVGFGRSALESLLAVDPDTVKIDRSLVSGADQGPSGRRPLEQLVAMLRGLEVDIIAEGVERPEQAEVLCELGVPFAQGFLWSRPDA